MSKRTQIWISLGIVYVVWGSTYVGIKLAVRTLPPLLASGLRFLVASAILAIVLLVVRRSLRVTRHELLGAAIVGTMLLAIGVGLVHVVERHIDSSVAAMIAGSVPLQIILWRTIAGDRVSRTTLGAAAFKTERGGIGVACRCLHALRIGRDRGRLSLRLSAARMIYRVFLISA